jgi:succinate dehydrogenase / fumarate reductase, membrane anchor subunit
MDAHKIIQESWLRIVAGLGSSKSGTGHWWHQRITSALLVPLGVWLIFSFISQVPHDYHGALLWVRQPSHLILLALTILITLYHGTLGLQVIIEDYIHRSWLKLSLLCLMKAFMLFMGISASMALSKIFFLPLP